jgi:hypothetical protein
VEEVSIEEFAEFEEAPHEDLASEFEKTMDGARGAEPQEAAEEFETAEEFEEVAPPPPPPKPAQRPPARPPAKPPAKKPLPED